MFLSATASQLVARKEQGALREKGSNHHGVPCVCDPSAGYRAAHTWDSLRERMFIHLV